MPVPNARILNPFVPRDDLGIEEDISNKLYLPSDVSLSLATMVGRNGRKPRVVQMDDDGSIFVALGSKGGAGSLRQVISLANNKEYSADGIVTIFDLLGYSRLVLVLFCISDDNDNGIITFTISNLMLDKTKVIATQSINLNATASSEFVLDAVSNASFFTRYAELSVAFTAPTTSAVMTIEAYLF